VQGVPKLIEFLKKAFNAVELHRHMKPNGEIAHAAMRIGTSTLMMGELPPERTPMLAMLYIYVEDVDAVYKTALMAGGTSVMEPTDQYYGDRSGAVHDPVGNQWWIATHKEDLTPEELTKKTKNAKR
jgi:uncharacterized glyoxalase superfamily protein PhnB